MNPFTKHPSEVGMSYFQHFIFALSVAFNLLMGVFSCTIHGFFPFFFTTTTSEIVSKQHQKMSHTKNQNQ